MVDISMAKVELKETSDITTSAIFVGGIWYSLIKMPWHNSMRIVCRKGERIPSSTQLAAVSIARQAAIGQWQDNTCGTQNGILKKDTKDQIEKVFGKPSRQRIKNRISNNRKRKSRC